MRKAGPSRISRSKVADEKRCDSRARGRLPSEGMASGGNKSPRLVSRGRVAVPGAEMSRSTVRRGHAQVTDGECYFLGQKPRKAPASLVVVGRSGPIIRSSHQEESQKRKRWPGCCERRLIPRPSGNAGSWRPQAEGISGRTDRLGLINPDRWESQEKQHLLRIGGP